MTIEETGLQNVLKLVQALGQGGLRDPEHGRCFEQTAMRVHGVHGSEEG
jgi:hypothetical protein